jgi:hypothetical protein
LKPEIIYAAEVQFTRNAAEQFERSSDLTFVSILQNDFGASQKLVYRELSGGLGTFRLIAVQRCGSFRGNAHQLFFGRTTPLHAFFMGC